MLQQNETGSNMNSRQAYISAKSGLDTFQDALKNSAITNSDLPQVSGDSSYYVLFYDGDKLDFQKAASEEDARNWTKKLAKNHTIVGGEGTYFKVQKHDNKFKVTALNVTGKYNANVSMNRGDLSFDAVIMSKYTFGLKDPTGGGTVPTPGTVPTGGIMTAPIPSAPTQETLPPPPPPAAPNGIGGDFLMIGQQSCLNEQKGDGGSVSSGTLLKQYFKGGDNGSFVAYAPSVENAKFGYTYFPIVYDRYVKVETDANRTTVKAIDEGIYLLGAASGYKDVDEFCNQNDHSGRTSLGVVSYITQNASYEMNFNCKFLCIKNNFVSIGKDSTVTYCGNENRGYVVAYLPNQVTFFVLSEDKYIEKSFTASPGYYMIKNGSAVCEATTWDDPLLPGEPEYDHYVNFNEYGRIMSYYDEVDGVKGEIHSGCHEDGAIEHPVAIVNNNGQFNLGQNASTGYTQQSSFTYDTSRDNQSIFLAPNTGVSQWGNYHWYCGRSFNFQWFNVDKFTVNSNCHIKISAPTIVLTIGPLVKDEAGNAINVSNYIEGQEGASLELYGNKGGGYPGKLNVMCSFNVTYRNSKKNLVTYPIIAGTYTNVPAGINLFSEAGEKYFLYEALAYDLQDANKIVKQPTPITTTRNSTASSVTPQSVSVQTNAISTLFSKLAEKLAVSPLSTTIYDNSEHKHTFKNAIDSNVKVDMGIKELYYTDDNTDSNKNIHTLRIGVETTIEKGVAVGEYKPYIVFEPGDYKIAAKAGETEINLYDVKELIKRTKESSSNFELKKEEPDKVEIVGKYY